LLHQGHRVTLAADGGEGMVLARAHRFDVILMDVSMPIMDGLTATQMIRYEGQSSTTRIIAVTAHSMPEDFERFKAAGMDDYLTKPISEADLVRVIARQAPDAVAAPAKRAIVNEDRLTDLAASMGAQGLHRAISWTLQDVPVILQRLQESAVNDRANDMIPAAHEAAGTCAMIGATELGQVMAGIESLCRDGDVEAAKVLLVGCNDLWQATAKELRKHLSN
jgi:CheY-like chemotaxis protein/HPt (histidine-containing phosphotransfer) domain-containing protein